MALLVPFVLFAASPKKPRASFYVRDFGATGNGLTKDTAAFQRALDTCAVSGGGEVRVPAGRYLIGSIQIGNRTMLRLEKDSVLAGTPDLEDYPIMDVRWEGRWQRGHRALICLVHLEDTGIIGPGRIEGNRAVAFGKGMRGAPVIKSVSYVNLLWDGPIGKTRGFFEIGSPILGVHILFIFAVSRNERQFKVGQCLGGDS
jgi:hypothetical protein